MPSRVPDNWDLGRFCTAFQTFDRQIYNGLLLVVGKNVCAQSTILGCALLEIKEQVAVRPRRRVHVGFLHVSRVLWTDLARKMRNLRAIARILENYDVIRVERYLALALMKKILRQKEYAEVSVMAGARKNIDHAFASFAHEIVYDDELRLGSCLVKVAALRGALPKFDVSFTREFSIGRLPLGIIKHDPSEASVAHVLQELQKLFDES